MKIEDENIGIITADIIDSTEIEYDLRTVLFSKFNDGLERIKKTIPIEYEWYRGDAFQVKVLNFRDSLKIILLIKFWVKSFEKESKKSYDVRISLGIGKNEWNQNQIVTSDGEAYRISGRNLDNLKSLKQSFIIDANDANSDAFRIESLLLNVIIDSITPIQSKVLFYKICGYKEEAIAKKINLAQSTINQHSNAGNWFAISKYLDYFEKKYAHE